jgi:transcriptional regulator with PAS, ATPase and Fis domain
MRESESAVTNPLDNLIGVSARMQALRTELADAAVSDAKVLLTGESGVGKEVASRAIHQLSRRAQMPMVAINCAGIPESLLESELFGHVRGSFTGAYRDRAGLIERANRGTLFLDEVCEMGPRMQGLLLRFLETGDIQPVGSDRGPSQLDVRIIAATNRDPLELVRSKVFREDLYYRLNVIDIWIPPLRERREDIPVLFDHFLKIYSAQHRMPQPALAADAVAWINEHEWPGNVRQMKNTVERLIVRGRGAVVTAAQLTGREPAGAPVSVAVPAAVPAASKSSLADAVYDRMVKNRESFWSAVHAAYMVRDLTRNDVRAIITRGLHETAGNYKILVELFNMDRSDYKRFLNFLRKHECQLPFADFRAVKSWHRELPDARFRASHASHASSAVSVRH